MDERKDIQQQGEKLDYRAPVRGRADFAAMAKAAGFSKLVKQDRNKDEKSAVSDAALRRARVVWNYPPASLARPKPQQQNVVKHLARSGKAYAPDWWMFTMKELDIGAAEFKAWRREHVYMNMRQAAAFFRVPVSTIAKWEGGTAMIPFTAAFMMRHFRDDPAVKLTRPGFQHWTVIYDFETKEPKLYNKEFGVEFTDDKLCWYRMRLDALARLEYESQQLREQLAAAEAENTRLRQMFKEHAITKELAAMHARLAELFAQVHTADVIEFPAPKVAAA